MTRTARTARPARALVAGFLAVAAVLAAPAVASADGPVPAGDFGDGEFVTPTAHTLRITGSAWIVDIDPWLAEPLWCEDLDVDLSVPVTDAPDVQWSGEWTANCGAAQGRISVVGAYDAWKHLLVTVTFSIQPDANFPVLGVPLLEDQSVSKGRLLTYGGWAESFYLPTPTLDGGPSSWASVDLVLE